MRGIQLACLIAVMCAGCARSAPLEVNRSIWAQPDVEYCAGRSKLRQLGEVGLQRLAHEALGAPLASGLEHRRLCKGCESGGFAESDAESVVAHRVVRDYIWGPSDVPGEAAPTPQLAPRAERLLPARLASNAVVRQYVSGITTSATGADNAKEIRLEPQELLQFGRAALEVSTDYQESEKTSVGRLMRLYLGAWVKGEFVDRSGRELPKPSVLGKASSLLGIEIPKVLIENEEILGFATVALEALIDAAAPIPVLYRLDASGGREYLNHGGKEPTFAKLFAFVQEVRPAELTIDLNKKCPTNELYQVYERGIAPEEASLITFVSELAGARSKSLSGFVVGLFKETKVEFILGAHFSFGDSDTFRLLVERLFEVGSRRITELLAYRTLQDFDFLICSASKRVRTVEGVGFKGLELSIALLIQEQGLLQKLLGGK